MLLPELEELLLALDGIEEKQEPQMGALGDMG
jgi:hypothetical protein